MSDRGTMFPVTATLFLAGALMVGLAVEIGTYAATWREASFAASAGAEAGAAVIRPGPAYRDRIRIDVDKAATIADQAARDARPRSGRRVEVEVEPRIVCVTVTQETGPGVLALLGARSRMVTATTCASPQRG